MWRNYLVVGFRSLARNKLYAVINLFGLTIGIAACLMILLYVRYETSYDGWLPEADRVFQVQTFGTHPTTGEKQDMQAVTRPVAEALAKDFPQLEVVSKLETDDVVLLKGGAALTVDAAAAADPAFFQIIQLPFLKGDPKTALQATDGVTLSRSEATRLFGSIDVIGRTLTSVRNDQKYELRVTGVFEDLPKNSHMRLNLVRRFNSAEELGCPWGCVNGFAYVKLRPGVDVETINREMPAWERRNVPPRDIGGSDIGAANDWRLTNVRDIHLGRAQDGARPGNDMRTIVTFTVVALLILGMAVVNFVNLTTARASQRAREVAVRKVLGASRRQLMSQFLGESMLLVAIAMLIALALVELMLPAFSTFLEADLNMQYLGRGGLLPTVAALTLIVGLAGGVYPAFYLSRFQPARVLKANKSSTDAHGGGRLRNSLVVAQFAVSIGLIACTAIVYQQTFFARSIDPGFQREGLLTINGLREPEVRRVREALTREIAGLEGVTGVSATLIAPGDGPVFFTAASVPGRPEPTKIGWYSVEPSFFETMKIDTVSGRALSSAYAKDRYFVDYEGPEEGVEPAQRAIAARGHNIVLNESGARLLGFRNPVAAVGKQIGVPLFGEEIGPAPATIVGVVRDSRFRSVREPVEPAIFYDDGYYRYLVVRFQSASPSEVRAAVERLWRRVLPETPFEASFADQELAGLYRTDEARGRTFAGFALLAIVIASLGLFGLAAFTAERRTKEIGVRKVFGATVEDIVRLLAWQFSKPVVLANLIAWPVAWWVMRDWLNGFDARIALTPGPFLFSGLLAVGIAVGTVSGHAIRVARTNPINALRYE